MFSINYFRKKKVKKRPNYPQTAACRRVPPIPQTCHVSRTHPRGPAQATHIPGLQPQTKSYVHQPKLPGTQRYRWLSKDRQRDPTLGAHAVIRPTRPFGRSLITLPYWMAGSCELAPPLRWAETDAVGPRPAPCLARATGSRHSAAHSAKTRLTDPLSLLSQNIRTLQASRDPPRPAIHNAASPRGTLSFSHSRHVARPPLVGLRTWCPNLIAEDAQSIDTFDLVPKKRVVPLRPACCSSPKSSAFRGT